MNDNQYLLREQTKVTTQPDAVDCPHDNANVCVISLKADANEMFAALRQERHQSEVYRKRMAEVEADNARLTTAAERLASLASLSGDPVEAFAKWSEEREKQTTWRPSPEERADANFFWSSGWKWASDRMSAHVATEQEMHAAWRKRAEESEQELTEVCRLTAALRVAAREKQWETKLLASQSALEAAERERDEARQRLLSAAGDDLCRLSQEEIKAMTAGEVPIPPKAEFLASCERFHAQVTATAGVNHGCLTLAQLIAENEKQRLSLTAAEQRLAEVERERDSLKESNVELMRKVLTAEAAEQRLAEVVGERDKLQKRIEELERELAAWDFMAKVVHIQCDRDEIPKPPENEPGIPWRVMWMLEELKALTTTQAEQLRKGMG